MLTRLPNGSPKNKSRARLDAGLIASAVLAVMLAAVGSGALAATHRLPLLPPASDAPRQGVVRILNHSGEAGDVAVTAIDDSGAAFGPVTLFVDAGQAIEFSSMDLERGNAQMGIATGIGGGQGDWRLVLETDLDIEPLVRVHTPSGFVGELDATVPRRSFYHIVSLLAPSGAFVRGGQLRLVNGSDTSAEVVLFGIDAAGRLAPGQLSTTLPGGGARTFDALELEQGKPGLLSGRLGHGNGNWRLLVFAQGEIEVMTLLDNPAGPLANLSSAGAADGDVPLFPPAGDPQRLGLLRVANRSDEGTVRIHAFDDAGQRHGPVTLDIEAGRTVSIDSNDLEQGNTANGLSAGLGDGDGEWRLLLESSLELHVQVHVRTPDGFTTSVHDGAARVGQRHYAPWFNPAGDLQSRGRLRLVNPSDEAAGIAIVGWDDEGAPAPGGAVGLTLPAGESRSLDAAALEEGAEGLDGSLGSGSGSWRFALRSDVDIRAMNLVESADGYLSGVSMSRSLAHFPDACFDAASDTDGDGVSDRCVEGLPSDLLSLRGCTDGRYVADPGNSPGLVGDCRVLVGIANAWARDGGLPEDHAMRRWGSADQATLDAWEGIEVAGGRIVGIDLAGSRREPGELSGAIPPELGRLTELASLNLSYNRLTGPIPAELGQLALLTQLNLSFNRLSGKVPQDLGDLPALQELNVSNNRLTGTVPWVLRDRSVQDGLAMLYDGNAITGLGAPPERPPPAWSNDPADNGNAAHHSVAWYQGPLVWEWDWRDDAVEYQQPVLGRWAALAVRIDHETATPPPVVTHILPGGGEVLPARLAEAAPPVTVATAPGQWRTEYMFDLPGSLFQAGTHIVHVIDPDNDMPETDEADNAGEPIPLYGVAVPHLRMTFIPVYFPGQEPPALDAGLLMRGIDALWPIAGDFEATLAAPLESEAANQYVLLNEVRALWNAEADPDEFYYGVFAESWAGGRGVAYRPGRVAVSEFTEFNTIPHEFGHNQGLRHPPGCGVSYPNRRYPYPDGGLGPHPGWDANWRRLVTDEDEAYADVMSYCGTLQFVSEYHYREVLEFWQADGPQQRPASVLIPFNADSGFGAGAAAADGPAGSAIGPSPGQAVAEPESPGGVALSGWIDAAGEWSLTHVQGTEKGPRAPSADGAYTLVLYDAEGRELYREPLSADALSDGPEAGWAARVPIPLRPAREVAILDAQGVAVLRTALPALR